MKNRCSCFVLVGVLFSSLSIARAQSLERSVIASSGGQGQSATAQITWTCGESVVPTLKSSTNYLSQGFQQPGTLLVTGLPADLPGLIGFTVFPVPCGNQLDIQASGASARIITWTLFSSGGAQIKSGKMTDLISHLDMADLQSGQYILRMTDEASGFVKSYSIIKMNN